MKYLKYYNNIFEYSINNIELDDYMINNIIKSTSWDEFDTDWFDSPREGLLNEFKKFKDLYSQYIKNGKIKIYRSIYLYDTWFEDLENKKIKRIGQFWSYDLKSAQPWDSNYGRDQKKRFYLVSTIDESYVDWISTFELFLIVPWEKEIRLHKNTPIKLDKILDENYNKLEIKNLNKYNLKV